MIRTFLHCDSCGKEISKSNFTKHLRRHEKHPETFEEAIYKLTHEGLNCQFCGKECKNRNSLCNHERLCRENPNRQISYRVNFNDEGRVAWNKGLTKDSDPRVLKNALNAKQYYQKHGGNFLGRTHSAATRYKLALMHKGNSYGNRSKKGYYKDIRCDSTYELAFIVYCFDHNIPVKRCSDYYTYEYHGKLHLYFPDFIVENTIIEIKGYHTELVDIKAKAVKDKPIKILYRKDLKDIFQYVFETYSVNIKTIVSLFDRN